jgi:hypothetical protein
LDRGGAPAYPSGGGGPFGLVLGGGVKMVLGAKVGIDVGNTSWD